MWPLLATYLQPLWRRLLWLAAVQAVKVAGAEASVVAHFYQLNEQRRRAALRFRLAEDILQRLGRNLGDLAIGLVRLFSQSLRDNTTLGLPLTGAAILTPDLPQLAHGLDTVVGPRGVKLSGGQVQRAAAARMFARQADLLLVDDLASALDVPTERQLWAQLRARQATVLAVSHRRLAREGADQILVLAWGRLTGRGTLADLLPRNAVLAGIWDSGA